jgi:hypothetical protein
MKSLITLLALVALGSQAGCASNPGIAETSRAPVNPVDRPTEPERVTPTSTHPANESTELALALASRTSGGADESIARSTAAPSGGHP